MIYKRQSPNRWYLQRGWICLAIWLFSLAAVRAQPVVLYLRGGDRLTGTITSEDTNRVILATQWAKEMVIPVREIFSRYLLPAGPEIKVGETKPVAPAPAGVTNPVVTAGVGGLTNTAPRPGTAAVSGPLAQVKAKPPKHWAGEAQAGVDLVFSERKRQLYSGRFKVTYVYDHFRNLFDYNLAYGKTDGLLSDDRMYGSSKTDFDLNKRSYVYNLGGAGYDQIRKIDLHYEVGPGFGYHVVKLTNLVLNTEFGANYQAQYQSDQTQSKLFFFRLAENSALTLNPRFSVDEKFEFFPRYDDWEKYRFRFETNLRYTLLGNLFFVVTVTDQYDTQPAQGVAKNDLQLRSSISLKF